MIPEEIKILAEEIAKACKKEGIDFFLCAAKSEKGKETSFMSKISVRENGTMLEMIHETMENWSLIKN